MSKAIKERRRKEGNYIRKWYGRYELLANSRTEARILEAFKKGCAKQQKPAREILLQFMESYASALKLYKKPEQLTLFEVISKFPIKRSKYENEKTKRSNKISDAVVPDNPIV